MSVWQDALLIKCKDNFIFYQLATSVPGAGTRERVKCQGWEDACPPPFSAKAKNDKTYLNIVPPASKSS
jgi:hypothetical protein